MTTSRTTFVSFMSETRGAVSDHVLSRYGENGINCSDNEDSQTCFASRRIFAREKYKSEVMCDNSLTVLLSLRYVLKQ